ncbi:hypothetical protein [Pseudomonas sp. WS 5011]|uniref:hypothetical protein n=1 Tax=Pseudomonas sp. WS 5011 TaxID=2717477 RepID=UPI0014753150|nr:hypothetical protein [Pseudomonas sp. WS 5011]NMY53241.1 hypothetical protein [Pseudomonas sp. WS 5011]
MKKITSFVFAMAASMSAFAAPVVMDATTGQMIIKTTDTTLLTENVRINLSNGVQAGAAVDADEIGLSTCHTAGRKSSRQVAKVTCVAGATAQDPQICTQDDPIVMVTASGAVMNTATTGAGTVLPVYPNTDCNSANAASAAGTKLTQ